MTREEEIKEMAKSYAREVCSSPCDVVATIQDFEAGARWADEHPRCPWISVEDRLPEEDGEYLTLFKRNNYMCILQFKNNFWKVAGYQSDITHWKPIITPEQEAERSKGCPNLRSWLAGCPVEGLRKPSLQWIAENLKAKEAAHQRVEECKQALEDAIKEEVKLNKF